MRSLAVVHALALALGLAGLAEAIITDSSRFMGYAIEPGGKTETWYCPTHLTSFVQSANFAECCATVANCGILTSCHQGSTLFNDRGYYLNWCVCFLLSRVLEPPPRGGCYRSLSSRETRATVTPTTMMRDGRGWNPPSPPPQKRNR